MTIRTYARRSKNDEGKQQFSLDVQDKGCRGWVATSLYAGGKIAAYVDDGKAGDDFHSRDGLRRLLADARAGDVIVCRDQSRLGRDAIEVTLVVRDLVKDRGCRLFYYADNAEVAFANAIDQATTFIKGTGHQMELEAIRSRTREALRSRVREGRIAGGRCFGYRLERKADGTGRPYTIAVIDDKQAEVVRRIFAWRCDGWGLKKIAHALNNEGVPAPRAGKRGTGSWAPSCIRSMLKNPRYRGVYVHGRRQKVRRAGTVTRMIAEPTDVITLELAEWRIVDDAIWTKAQEQFSTHEARRKVSQPRAKYALTGIARCGVCSGSVGVANGRRNRQTVKSYVCVQHHQRGPAVCPVTIYQPMEDIEQALVTYLERDVLTPALITSMAEEIRGVIEAQLPSREADAATLEEELRTVKAEQKRLTKAVALADDVPELIAELKQRANRARNLEVRIATIRRTPKELRSIVDQAEANVRARLTNLRDALRDRADLRQVFLTLFPNGLVFSPDRVGARQVWRLEGAAAIGRVALNDNDPWFNLRGNPVDAADGSQAGHGADEDARKNGHLHSAPPSPTPDEGGWFNMRCDPDGI